MNPSDTNSRQAADAVFEATARQHRLAFLRLSPAERLKAAAEMSEACAALAEAGRKAREREVSGRDGRPPG